MVIEFFTLAVCKTCTLAFKAPSSDIDGVSPLISGKVRVEDGVDVRILSNTVSFEYSIITGAVVENCTLLPIGGELVILSI